MPVRAAFQPEVVTIKIADIVLLTALKPAYRKSKTYVRIAASVRTIGIIEPLVVFPAAGGKYILLEGHTRLDILSSAGADTVDCILSTDNESYTYNKRVNYIPPIAQHQMILRALAHVSEERIAAALNISVASIRQKRDMLKGICTEAVELLRNERVSAGAFCVLRKMKPLRQIEAARLMIGAMRFSGRFANALLLGTRQELLVNPPVQPPVTSPAQRSMMAEETDSLLQNMDSIREQYGNQVLTLTTACRYVEKLAANVRIHRYMAKRHPDTLGALEQLLADVNADKQRRPPPKKSGPSELKAASG